MRSLLIALLLCFGILFPTVHGQEIPSEVVEGEVVTFEIVEPILLGIQGPTEIQQERNSIFRVTGWDTLPAVVRESARIEWSLGDGTTIEGREVVHTYTTPGVYSVELRLSYSDEVTITSHEVFVFEELYVVLLDSDWRVYRDPLLDAARDRGIFLSFIELRSSTSLLSSGGDWTALTAKQREHLEAAPIIFMGEDGQQGLNMLSAYKREHPEFDFRGKRIVVATSSNLFIFQRIASRSLSSISARDLFLTDQDLLSVLYGVVTAMTVDDFMNQLQATRGVQVVDKEKETPGLTNFISYFINEAISRGLPGDLFLFILLLPVIVTIISFFRQVVGLDTLGIFMPTVLTLSFVVLGLQSALIILTVIVVINLLTRTVLKRFYMAYAPKMAIVVSVACLAILAMIIAGVYVDITFGIDVSQSSRAVLSIFPIIIMVMLAEQIMNIQNNRGPRSTIRIIAEMIFTCILTYGLVTMEMMKIFIFAYPEIIVLLTLVVDLLLGRFTGLRLMEYLRFRDLFFHETEE